MGTPNTVQGDWRGRNDNGGEAGATWKTGSNNQNWSQDVDETFRLRFVIYNTGTKNEVDGYRLHFRVNGGTYSGVSTSSSVVKAVDSANTTWTLTDEDDTTQQIGSSSNYTAGRWDNTGTTGEITLPYSDPDTETELEFCLQFISGDLQNEDVVEFRLGFDDGTALDGYGTLPTFTISMGAPTGQPMMLRGTNVPHLRQWQPRI